MSSPWIGIPVLTFLAAAIIAALYGLWRLARAIRYEAREAQHTAAGVRADPFADQDDRDDPHGDNWPPPADPGDGPWGQSLPFRVELLTRPGRLDMSPDGPEPDPDDDDKTTEVAAWACDLGIPTDNNAFVAGLFESARQEAIAAEWDQRQAEGRSDLEAKVIP